MLSLLKYVKIRSIDTDDLSDLNYLNLFINIKILNLWSNQISKNKVYLITGANGRIGYALSKRLIVLGAKIIMSDILINKIKLFSSNKNCLIKKIDIIQEKILKRLYPWGVKI